MMPRVAPGIQKDDDNNDDDEWSFKKYDLAKFQSNFTGLTVSDFL